MCGFFAFSTGLSARQLADLFDVTNLPHSMDSLQSLKYFPKSTIPTISQNSPNRLIMRYWSLIPSWWSKPLEEFKFSTFNARSEDIDTKPTYQKPWQQNQRCLIPATWFYEFQVIREQKRTKKIPYRVEDPGQKIMTLAGLYNLWQDAQGKKIESVTIITCQATENVAPVHQRQPVVISPANRQLWLDRRNSSYQVRHLLQPSIHLVPQPISLEFNRAFGSEVTRDMVVPNSQR